MPLPVRRCVLGLRNTMKNHYRKFILIGLAICFSLSANVALAAHQLVEDESGILELQPTEKAGDATGQVEFEGVKENGGTQSTVGLNGKLQIKDLNNPEDVEVFVVDEETDQRVSLGRLDKDGELEGDVTVPEKDLKELEAFDSIEIVRQSKNGGKDVVLFTADLPHGKP